MWGRQRAGPALLGLQIADQAVRLVELEPDRHGRPLLRHAASANLPEAAVRGAELLQPQAVQAALQQLLGAVTTRAVALELPLEAVYTRDLCFPAGLDADQLAPLVELEAAQLLASAPGGLALDYSRRGPDPEHPGCQRVLLAAARQQQVLQRQQLALQAGLDPVALDVDAFATRRAALSLLGERALGELALVELDQRGLSLQLLRDGEGLVQQRLALVWPQSAAARVATVLGALRIAADAVRLPPPGRLTLSGDPDLANPLAAALAQQPELDCSVFDPWPALAAVRPQQPQFAVACGLALRRFGP